MAKLTAFFIVLLSCTSCFGIKDLSSPSKCLYALGKATVSNDTARIKYVMYDTASYDRFMAKWRYKKMLPKTNGFIYAYKHKLLEEHIDEDIGRVYLTIVSKNNQGGSRTMYTFRKVNTQWKFIGQFNEHWWTYVHHLSTKKPLRYHLRGQKGVIPTGFEPVTDRLEICCSIQLSYGTIAMVFAVQICKKIGNS